MNILSNENIIILKYENIKILRKALCYKWEGIILLFLIPEIITQMILAQGGFKIASVSILSLLFFACFYGVKEIRKESLQDLRKYERKLKREVEKSCIKKRSYSSKQKMIFDQKYNHSLIFTR